MSRPIIASPRSLVAGAAERRSISEIELPVTGPIDVRLSELLTARLCHELSGPIAAINNGIELLAEDEEGEGREASPGTSFLRDAVALVGDSARRAGSRLQFYRFAYGFGGGARAGPAPHELALGYFEAS